MYCRPQTCEINCNHFIIPFSTRKLPSVFEFLTATTHKKAVTTESADEHTLSRIRSEEFDVLCGNAIAMMGGCQYLILVGLSEEQKKLSRLSRPL
jgi:hypothetical protein